MHVLFRTAWVVVYRTLHRYAVSAAQRVTETILAAPAGDAEPPAGRSLPHVQGESRAGSPGVSATPI